MTDAYLLIGGNMGNREAYLTGAIAALAESCGSIAALSSIYETEAWGKLDQPSFLNQAVHLRTALPAAELLRRILQAEEGLGRRRMERYGPRTIDIDILLYGRAVIDEPKLQVPHPQLANRRFALQCLCDLAPSLVHPVLHKPMQQLLAECPDPLTVHKFS